MGHKVGRPYQTLSLACANIHIHGILPLQDIHQNHQHHTHNLAPSEELYMGHKETNKSIIFFHSVYCGFWPQQSTGHDPGQPV